LPKACLAFLRLGVPKEIARKDGVHAKTLRRQGRGWAAVRLFLVPCPWFFVGAMLLSASVCIKWGLSPKRGIYNAGKSCYKYVMFNDSFVKSN